MSMITAIPIALVTAVISTAMPLSIKAEGSGDELEGYSASDVAVNIPPSPALTERAKYESWLKDRHYRGIAVEAHPEAVGGALEIQEQMAALMNRLDFVPPERLAHFSYLLRQHEKRDWLTGKPLQGTITGWRGRIVGMAPAQGGYQVSIKVTPRHTCGMTRIGDHMIEHYLCTAHGELRHIGSEASPGPKVTVFP